MPSRKLYIDFGCKVKNINETDLYLTDSQKLYGEQFPKYSNIFKMDFELLIQN